MSQDNEQQTNQAPPSQNASGQGTTSQVKNPLTRQELEMVYAGWDAMKVRPGMEATAIAAQQRIQTALEALAGKEDWINNFLNDPTAANIMGRPPTRTDAEKQWERQYNQIFDDARSWSQTLKSATQPGTNRTEAQDNLAAAQGRYQDAHAAYQEELNRQMAKNRGTEDKPITGFTDKDWFSAQAELANQHLAQQKLALDQQYRNGQLSLEQAKHEYEKVWNQTLLLERQADRTSREDQAQREDLLKIWQTETSANQSQYGTDVGAATRKYEADVSQRGQDTNAVMQQAALLGKMAGDFLPFMIPQGQLDSLNAGFAKGGHFGPIASSPTGGITPGSMYSAAASYAPTAFGGPTPAPIAPPQLPPAPNAPLPPQLAQSTGYYPPFTPPMGGSPQPDDFLNDEGAA